ncbi:MAG: RagB/SusD family nutrient uptake outer membrane protein [Balneolaceae bacterium]|nr:RagB/SusD family nutrient uptake outer membrane protein [Balneolaceae bacterium]
MKKNNNKMIFRNSLIILVFLFTGISCDNFLVEEHPTQLTSNFVYTNAEGLELGLVGLYNRHRNFYENGEWNFTPPMILQTKSDLAFGRTGESSLYSILTWGATASDFGTTRYGHSWRNNYLVIDRANAIIQAAEEIEDIGDAQRNKILGEAKFFRAQAYFNLYRQFNNIFITTEPTTPENADFIINDKATEEEIFQLINSDLLFSIEHLSWTAEEFGRVTNGAARHLKAKVAMWQEDWQEALFQSLEVINSPYHDLLPSTADVFRGNLQHEEALFVVQYEELVTGGGAMHRFNFQMMPQYGVIPGAMYSDDQGGRGAGFILLNQYFRSLLLEDENDTRHQNTYYYFTFFYNNPSTLPEGKNLGDVMDDYDEFSDDLSERNLFFARLNPGIAKFNDENTSDTQGAGRAKNIMVYRLAETYLMAAESQWRISGNNADPQALQYLNTIRLRAEAEPVTSIDLQVIMDEDAREMGFEGHRWYNLKRWGVLYEQIRNHAGNVFETRSGELVSHRAEARDRIQPHMVNLPIPPDEFRLLGPGFPQNDGY